MNKDEHISFTLPGTLKTRARKCRTGRCGEKMQGWKWGVENAGPGKVRVNWNGMRDCRNMRPNEVRRRRRRRRIYFPQKNNSKTTNNK